MASWQHLSKMNVAGSHIASGGGRGGGEESRRTDGRYEEKFDYGGASPVAVGRAGEAR